MEQPLFVTFLAEVENLAREYELDVVTFGFNQKPFENGHKGQPSLTVKFQPKGKGK